MLAGGIAYRAITAWRERSWSPRERATESYVEAGSHVYGIGTWLSLLAQRRALSGWYQSCVHAAQDHAYVAQGTGTGNAQYVLAGVPPTCQQWSSIPIPGGWR
ncbi:hypothetical protein EPN42_10160 [bacterium]|nr:MAG: hypothetical protein EPN42_10160 [bacterium]